MLAGRQLLVAMTLLVALFGPSGASAAPITLTAIGTLTTITDPDNILAGLGFATGQTVTFATEFDPTGLVDADVTPTGGSYSSFAHATSAAVNGHTFQFGDTALLLFNEFADTLFIGGFGTGTTSLQGFDLHALTMILTDPTGTALTTDALVFPPSLPAFTSRQILITLGQPISPAFPRATLLATIDSVNVVPEPATLTLVGLGVAGIALRRRRSSRASAG